jgi:hypothetical protein
MELGALASMPSLAPSPTRLIDLTYPASRSSRNCNLDFPFAIKRLRAK